MAIKRVVSVEFWTDALVVSKFSGEDRFFMLYLLTNPHTTQLGIYELIPRMAAFEMGIETEAVERLLKRFQDEYDMIRYSEETGEVAIKNYLRHSIMKGGKPVLDLITKEAGLVKDRSLLRYIYDSARKSDNSTVNEFVKTVLIPEIKNDRRNELVEGTHDDTLVEHHSEPANERSIESHDESCSDWGNERSIESHDESCSDWANERSIESHDESCSDWGNEWGGNDNDNENDNDNVVVVRACVRERGRSSPEQNHDHDQGQSILKIHKPPDNENLYGLTDAEIENTQKALLRVEDAAVGAGLSWSLTNLQYAERMIVDYTEDWVIAAIERVSLRAANKQSWGAVAGILKSWKEKGGIDSPEFYGGGSGVRGSPVGVGSSCDEDDLIPWVD